MNHMQSRQRRCVSEGNSLCAKTKSFYGKGAAPAPLPYSAAGAP